VPTFNNVADKIAFCFTPLTTAQSVHSRNGVVSVLYLLRRELIETAGHDPNVHDEGHVELKGVKHRLFISLIGMFTGFDLLAKLQLGDQGGVRERTKIFLQSLSGAGLSANDADLFYTIRNSLIHAFGAPTDEEWLRKRQLSGVGIAQREELPHGRLLVVKESPATKMAWIYVDGVCGVWRRAIEQSDRHFQNSPDTHRRFEKMFDKYGTLGMFA
jgi:hypothetical protein